jgi:hypothetical protein
MKDELFQQLAASLNEGGAILSVLIIGTCLPCAAKQPASATQPSSSAAEGSNDKSLADIRKRFATMKIKALDDYLAANPNAGDFRMGLLEIFYCYRNEVRDRERALSTLDRFYEYLVANPGELKEGLRHLFECYVGMEDEERAMVALEREWSLSRAVQSDR